ncbi:GDSL family lipase [Roseivirga sp. 4D4]|uniref:SGNH/GDSL hydrolase family protein n=1 Tax=Roseivirga sp. 4D4 TaxID=1889784 RepID=UPI000852B0C7|nr:SGNH/GDSL hydrolase family protein [Roseivirga sp. 4D4]OEK00684.1 GDSL family lipase [Roseivirga sp. 4D4]
MNLKYILGTIISIPLLPIMYYQGKRIRKTIPSLPEAKGPSGTVKQENEAKPITILAIGESTFAGVGVATHDEGFTGSFAKAIAASYNTSVDWKVYARSGYTAKKVTERILPKVEEASADLILIGLGGNDAFTLNRPHQWRKDINLLIEKLRKKYPETPIVFTNMPPIKEFPAFTPLIHFVVGNLVEILGEELNELIKHHPKVYYNSAVLTIAHWSKVLGVPPDKSTFFSDGVHPSRFTYQVWAQEMARFVKENEIL